MVKKHPYLFDYYYCTYFGMEKSTSTAATFSTLLSATTAKLAKPRTTPSFTVYPVRPTTPMGDLITTTMKPVFAASLGPSTAHDGSGDFSLARSTWLWQLRVTYCLAEVERLSTKTHVEAVESAVGVE
ncbi:unnamed protein product [Nippostrongylus brasiliensis]|uniref:Uncharacterized protein n=1 Tax=Nippostrongylus brasiliensis TaxID=27835 RepID=A0A0N4YMU6_NIPBR|nr:unnamed protein product [Nippostrongylus brasiliensis]